MNGSEIITKLLTDNCIELIDGYRGAQKHHRMRCTICDHRWSATPTSKIQGYHLRKTKGCPNCKINTVTKKAKKAFLEQIDIRNIKYPEAKIWLHPADQPYINSKTKMGFICQEGHKWTAATYGGYANKGCPHCKLINDSNNKRTSLAQVKQQ